MLRIYYITENTAKVRSLELYFEDFNVKIEQVPQDILEPDNMTTEDIAALKASEAQRMLSQVGAVSNRTLNWIILTNDSSFEINALNGWPGVRVKRELEELGLDKFLEIMQDQTNRSCAFVESMACIMPGRKEPMVFSVRKEGSFAFLPSEVSIL